MFNSEMPRRLAVYFPSLSMHCDIKKFKYQDLFDIFDLDEKLISDILLVETFQWSYMDSFVIYNNGRTIRSSSYANNSTGSDDVMGRDDFNACIFHFLIHNYTDDYVKFKLI